MSSKITNVVIAGLGGQGVIKASNILSSVAFAAGLEVKKSEIHGMSQRGGSVSSDVRFGESVYSPMVPLGEADYLLITALDQVEVNRPFLRRGGVLLEPSQIDTAKLASQKSINVALLGALSRYLDFSDEDWHEALRSNLAEKLHTGNFAAFELGKESRQ